MIICDILFLVIILFEIFLLIIAKNEKSIKHFKIFYGTFFGLFLSNIAYYIYTASDLYTFDCSGWNSITNLFYATIVFILNFILMFISLLFRFVSKDKKNYNNRSPKFIGLKHFILISVICCSIIFVHFMIRLHQKTTIDNEILDITLNYLKTKYGNEEFELGEVEREFVDSGWIETDSLDCYEIDVVHRESHVEFDVILPADLENNVEVDKIYDDFVSLYYEKAHNIDDLKSVSAIKRNAFEDYLKLKNLNIDVSDDDYYIYNPEYVVSNDYGRIPSKEEYFDLKINYYLRNEIRLTIDQNELLGNDIESELKDYLYNLAGYIIDYYDDLDRFNIQCYYTSLDDVFYSGKLIINKDYIILDFNKFEDNKKRK